MAKCDFKKVAKQLATWPQALFNGSRPSVPGPRPSGSASVHEISAKIIHVAWFTSSLFLWMQLLWNKLDGPKIQFCVANVISFSYNQEPLMGKTELRARETFVNKIICPVDPYENHDSKSLILIKTTWKNS